MGIKDHSSDRFCDLRDDGVSKGFKAVQFFGYPMRRSHSSALTMTPLHPGCFCIDGASWFAAAVGVAKNPVARPPVIASDGASRNTKRCDFVTDGFQVNRHLLEDQIGCSSNIFTNDPSGLEDFNSSAHFRPEVNSGSFSMGRITKWLTGESSTDEVNWIDPCPVNGSDVVMAWNVWPVVSQDLSAKVIDFNLPLDGHASSFKSKVKAPYA